MSTDYDLDVVLFGATSFVGRLCAEYLARAAPPQGRVGLAARLGDLQASFGGRATDWPLLLAHTDPRSLSELAETTRVPATTVGPTGVTGWE